MLHQFEVGMCTPITVHYSQTIFSKAEKKTLARKNRWFSRNCGLFVYG